MLVEWAIVSQCFSYDHMAGVGRVFNHLSELLLNQLYQSNHSATVTFIYKLDKGILACISVRELHIYITTIHT